MTSNLSAARFDPLPHIIFHDDFDRGMCGWTALIGNYEGSLDSMLPQYRDLRPPMLSTLSAWDTGTAGSLDGNYALKLATRARTGSLAVALKRLTWRYAGRIQMEYYFTFKPEASEMTLSELDLRTVGFAIDLQHGDRYPGEQQRVMPHLRYLNAWEGKPVKRWQFKRAVEALHDIGGSGKTRSHFHLAHEGWENLADGKQELCYNEIATKQNWYYLKIGFDLSRMAYTAFRCNDREFDVSQIEPMKFAAMPNLDNRVNSSSIWKKHASMPFVKKR
jgi:hypothetical protein